MMRTATVTALGGWLLPAVAFAGTLTVDSPFLRDASGRVVFFHGVNAIWKRPPYYPPSSAYSVGAASPAASYFDASDATWLSANGLTTVRLGVLWAGLEPTQGHFDDTYLDRIAELVDMLGAEGIQVLLDFHQDMYNEIYNGQGFPAWTTPNDPVPNLPFFGFPGNYFANPATMHAFDRLWLNQDGLQQKLRGFWARVARRFASTPNLLGYDLMNEPWAGTQWPTCLNTQGCPAFDVGFLQPFFENAFAAIRAAGDTDHVVWWEPQVIADGGAGNSVGLLAPIADSQGKTGLSFHSYCASTLFGSSAPPVDPSCPVNADLAFRQQAQAGSRNHSALLLSEFGASDSLSYVGLFPPLADQHMVSWHYWQYGGWNDPTGNSAQEGLFTNDLVRPGSLKNDKADLLIRTYPQAVAGAPTSFAFDAATKEFTLTFTTADPVITEPTEIFVPVDRHYGGSYCASVTGQAGITSAPNAPLLKVVNDGNPGTVTVRVTKLPCPTS